MCISSYSTKPPTRATYNNDMTSAFTLPTGPLQTHPREKTMNKPNVIPYGHPGFLAAYGAVWSSGDGALLASYFSVDGSYVESSYNHSYDGREQIARFSRFMHAFSRDVKIEYVSHCGDTELFALEWVWSGIATGPIRIDGVVYPASNTRYEIPGAAICRANEHGEITYHRDYYDLLTLMRQLGIAPSQGE